MWSFIVFVVIIISAIYIGRKNMKARVAELTKNADEYKDELISKYLTLSKDNQSKFLNLLDTKERFYMKSLLDNSVDYRNNSWNIQQHMILQQEIMLKLKHIKTNN